MFIRRHFYDLSTGETLHSYMMQGYIKPVAIEQDAENYNLENYGVFEWTEPDEQIEKNFLEAYDVIVDVSKTPHELVFDFTPPPEPVPEPSYEDYYNAIAEVLEGGVQE